MRNPGLLDLRCFKARGEARLLTSLGRGRHAPELSKSLMGERSIPHPYLGRRPLGPQSRERECGRDGRQAAVRRFLPEFEEWSQRRLEGREVVYVWADGICVKAGLERDKAALLVVLGAMRDGTKEVLALRSGYRESLESCSEVLRDLKARGIEAPRLLMADGNAAIWGAVRQVWPEAGEQRCWNHKMRNVLDRLPQREQSEARDLLKGRGLRTEPGRGCEGPRSVRQALQAVVSEGGGRTLRTIGSGWWRSTTSPRITRSIYARRTWSRARSLRYGSGRRRRSDSSGSRALRR